MDDDQTTDAVAMTVDIVASYVVHNNLRADDMAAFIATVHAAIIALGDGRKDDVAPAEQHKPAVTVRRSLSSRDHIVSMIDGKSYRSLKRHLTANGMTPQEYRQRYGLKPDYPMVAPGYSEARSEVAKKLGLGRKPAAPIAAEATPPVEPKRRRGKAASQVAQVGD